MKQFFILLISLVPFLADAQGQPSGPPNPSSSGYAKYGYMESTQGYLFVSRDTNWTPIKPALVLWQHGGVDTIYWQYNGTKWLRLTPSTSGYISRLDLSALTPILYNNSTGVFSADTGFNKSQLITGGWFYKGIDSLAGALTLENILNNPNGSNLLADHSIDGSGHELDFGNFSGINLEGTENGLFWQIKTGDGATGVGLQSISSINDDFIYLNNNSLELGTALNTGGGSPGRITLYNDSVQIGFNYPGTGVVVQINSDSTNAPINFTYQDTRLGLHRSSIGAIAGDYLNYANGKVNLGGSGTSDPSITTPNTFRVIKNTTLSAQGGNGSILGQATVTNYNNPGGVNTNSIRSSNVGLLILPVQSATSNVVHQFTTNGAGGSELRLSNFNNALSNPFFREETNAGINGNVSLVRLIDWDSLSVGNTWGIAARLPSYNAQYQFTSGTDSFHSFITGGTQFGGGSTFHENHAVFLDVPAIKPLFPTCDTCDAIWVRGQGDRVIFDDSTTLLNHISTTATATKILGLDANNRIVSTTASGLTPSLQAVVAVGGTTTNPIFLSGIAGTGYLNFAPQTSATPMPSIGNSIFDSAGINYIGSNGNGIRLSKSLIPALQRQVDSFPNASGVFILNRDTTAMIKPYNVITDGGLTAKQTSSYNNSTDIVQNIVAQTGILMAPNQNTLGIVTYPPGFGYIPFTTIRGPQFGYHTSIDNIYIFRDSFMCRRAGGLTYYVSESGNDANTGLSPDQAFRKIATAVAAANCLTVRVLGGVYGINEWPTGNQTASINFIISPDAHIGSFLKKSTWAQDGTYSQLVYVQDSHVNGAFTALYNRLVKETLSGNFRRFEPAGSLIECSTRFGTYFISNDTLWANYPTAPGNDYNSLLFQTNGRIVITNTTRHDSCYWEGGRLYGTELWQMDGTAGIVPFAAQRDVNIVRSSGTFDVINSKGYSLGSYAVTIWQAGTGDGFNYHTQGNQLGTDTMRNWEINCRVLDEKGQADHDQASTLHNHAKCMTINCQYISNGDQVIHDIDTSLRCILGSQLLSVEGESVVRASALTQTYIQNTTLGGGFNTTYDLFADSGTIWLDGTIFRKPILFTITSFIKKWLNP